MTAYTPALLLTALCIASQATAAITYGPQIATLETSRTWRDNGGGVLASDTASSGPLSYGPNFPAQNIPGVNSPTSTLPAPGFSPWAATAFVEAQLQQQGNSQWMRSMGSGGALVGFDNPATGTGTLTVQVTHTVDFQIDVATPWIASLRTVLSSPVYPRFDIIRDPAGAATTVFSDQMLTTDLDLQLDVAGTLVPGSYRAVMTFPLSFEVPSTPVHYGAHHGAFTTFEIPAPGTVSILLGAGLAAFRRSRRA